MGSGVGAEKGRHGGLQVREPGVAVGAEALRQAGEAPGPVPHVIAIQVSKSVLDRILGWQVEAVPGPEPGREQHPAGPLTLTQIYYLYFPYQVPIGSGFL